MQRFVAHQPSLFPSTSSTSDRLAKEARVNKLKSSVVIHKPSPSSSDTRPINKPRPLQSISNVNTNRGLVSNNTSQTRKSSIPTLDGKQLAGVCCSKTTTPGGTNAKKMTTTTTRQSTSNTARQQLVDYDDDFASVTSSELDENTVLASSQRRLQLKKRSNPTTFTKTSNGYKSQGGRFKDRSAITICVQDDSPSPPPLTSTPNGGSEIANAVEQVKTQAICKASMLSSISSGDCNDDTIDNKQTTFERTATLVDDTHLSVDETPTNDMKKANPIVDSGVCKSTSTLNIPSDEKGDDCGKCDDNESDTSLNEMVQMDVRLFHKHKL